jgi:hypothetical protein
MRWTLLTLGLLLAGCYGTSVVDGLNPTTHYMLFLEPSKPADPSMAKALDDVRERSLLLIVDPDRKELSSRIKSSSLTFRASTDGRRWILREESELRLELQPTPEDPHTGTFEAQLGSERAHGEFALRAGW